MNENISVIIPAYNEEKVISETLVSLNKSGFLDVIVVDNGSSDRTAKIAKSHGARVIKSTAGTIAAVRNQGVKCSKADFYIFIDADITVTENWHKMLSSTIHTLLENPMMVTGSRVQTSAEKNFVNKYWYSQLLEYEAPYINSGHLITTKILFEAIGGFSEDLVTAEDYDFCLKAKRAGALIYNNPALQVIHEGYPVNILGMIQRERWHGAQDVKNLNSFLDSKVAWIAAFNLVFFIVALITSFIFSCMGMIIYFTGMYFVTFALSIYKFGIKPLKYLFITPVFFYFYLCGRSLALVDRMLGKKI